MSNNTLTHYTTDQIKNPILLAEHFSKSGYFKDTSDVSKAIVKIVAGQELGFGPMASMAGINMIQGKPALSSNLMAAAVKKSGKYNFKVMEITDEICTIKFFEAGEESGVSTFTAEDAKRAGTQNMGKFPKNMLYARALSNGAKWFCPDVLNGSPIYTPEELGAEVNEDGEVISTTPIQQEQDAETPPPTPKQIQKIAICISEIAKHKKASVEIVKANIYQKLGITSSKDLTINQATKLIDNLQKQIEKMQSENTVLVDPETKEVEVVETEENKEVVNNF